MIFFEDQIKAWSYYQGFLILSAIFALAVGTSCVQMAGSDNRNGPEIVRVESGLLRGVVTNDIVRFMGIPYAASPVGDLRWASPQPAPSWSGTRDAAQPGCACEQGKGDKPSADIGEDCLYLNITAPHTLNRRHPRPVMVWLHGGGFSAGTGKTYDPQRLVTEGDVIVVTVNFRLNIFGYFGYPGLKDSGTYGLQDQQAALRWVKRNIAAFGGDPGNVTLFGESGGSVAACAQLTSPGARGLFQKVILQSGAATTSWPRDAAGLPNSSFWRPLQEVEAVGVDLAVKMGMSGAQEEIIKQLRALPASNLLAHAIEFPTAAYGGRVLPMHPAKALQEGRFIKVPVLSGFDRDEARGMASGMQLLGKPITDERYRELLNEAFHERTIEVERAYPRTRYPSAALAWSAIYSDRMFIWPQLAANRYLARKVPVFAYEFADPNAPGLIPFLPDFPSGASHSGELPFLFEVENAPIDITTGKLIPLTDPQKALAKTMIRYWTQFAHSGNPNGDGMPHWPRFEATGETAPVQVLTSDSGGIGPSGDAFLRHHFKFWEAFGK